MILKNSITLVTFLFIYNLICGQAPNHPFPQHINYTQGYIQPNNYT